MTPASPGVSKVFSPAKPRDLSLLQDPKILSAVVPASALNVHKESLYLESLYDNPLTPLNYGSAVSVSGDFSSTLEVGLHIVATALTKQHWSCVVDPTGRASSLALYEASTNSPRFVCVRQFHATSSASRFVSVMSHLVGSMRVVVAHVPERINAQHMARLMARVRENNTIMVFLDPSGLCEASFDRRIRANTLSFEGLHSGSGVLTQRRMKIDEYEHGVKISRPDEPVVKPLTAVRYA